MSEYLSSLQDFLWLVFILAIFIIFAIPQFLDLGKSIYLFFRVLLSPKKEPIMRLVRKLMDMPDDLALHIISNTITINSSNNNFDDLIRRFTTIVNKPIGINSTSTGQVTTKYYLDFVAACCDAVVLNRIANHLAYLIVETLDKKDYNFDYIVSMSKSNVLIGLEVSKILKRPFYVIGPSHDSGSRSFPITNSKRKLKFVLVDGIISTGEEVLNIARIISSEGYEMRYVFVAVDRCFNAKDRLRKESPCAVPIELFSISDYDDKKISAVLSGTVRETLRKR